MKISRIAALGGGISALLLGATLLAPSAMADTPPTVGSTTGTAGGGSGNASVFNIAGLRTNEAGTTLLTPYDNDPPPNSDNHFVVVPNLDDNPVQWATMYVFINNPSGVLQVEKTITSVGADASGVKDPTKDKVVWDDLNPSSAIKTGTACVTLLGSNTASLSVANGLISTGQKTAAEIDAARNGCQQGIVGILPNPIPISKHLPPGWYKICAILAQTGGATTSPVCEYFRILPITGFATDVSTVNYGTLTQNVRSIFGGDFTMQTGSGTNPGTIQGIGNTSPKLLVAYSWMNNTMGTTDPADDKYIKSFFDAQINRQDINGNIVATMFKGAILGGNRADSATPFGTDADLTLGESTGSLVPICLEPNENLKLDFSVNPQDVLYTGTYDGLVRLTVTNASSPCRPSLGPGEMANGDTDSNVINNIPSTNYVYDGATP